MSTITINNAGVVSVLIGGTVETHILASPSAALWEIETDAGDDLIRATDGAVGEPESWVVLDENGVTWKVTVDDDGILAVESFEQNIVIAPVVHAPIVFDGAVAEGYQLFIYDAATQNPATVFTNGTVIETIGIPVLLNAFGLPEQPIYIIVGMPYDVFLVPPGGGQPVKEWRHLVGGVPIDSGSATEWSGGTFQASYVSPTQVVVAGDVRSTFGIGRRGRVRLNTLDAHGTVTGVTYDGVSTTITLTMDIFAITNDATQIEAALLTPGGGAVPSRRNAFGRTIFSGDVTIPVSEGINLLPVSTLILHINPPPSGFLLCDGAAVSRTTYAALFAAISTTFGVGDGSTTFNLPTLAAVGSLNRYIYAKG